MSIFSSPAHSPTASFYDMSDESEDEYSTIQARTGKTETGVKLLFAKDKVYLHPTASAKDNISGFIAILQQKPSKSSSRDVDTLLLSWTPESSLNDVRDLYSKVDLTSSDEPFSPSPLVPPPPVTTSHSTSLGTYAFAVQLNDIYSLTVRPPSNGWWFGSIIINTKAGESFPPLFLHDSECSSTASQRKRRSESESFWGGDEVLRWLKRYVTIEKSHEPSIYLVNPSETDKASFGKKPTQDHVRNLLEGKPKDNVQDTEEDPISKALKQVKWNFLETMSHVTTFTRRTAQAVVEHQNVPPQVRRLLQNPQVQTVSEEFDSARLYLARWAMGIAEQSERERNQRIWTAKDVMAKETSEFGEFEILDMQDLGLSDRRHPVTLKEWTGFFNSHTGRLEKTTDEVKERIFHGGLADDGVRKEAWLFLLGVYEWDSSSEERSAKMNSLRDEYIRLKGAWWERMVDEQGTLEEREWWKEQKNRIEKDVHRTDRHLPIFAGEDIPHPDPDSPFAEAGTNVHLEQMKDMLLTYNEYNKDLGYVQGMSDLLAPIYAIEQDDAVAFWAFVGCMNRMESNFLRDQSGMRRQLLTLDQMTQLLDPKLYMHLQKTDSTNFFFCFRMLLVLFKREFDIPDILTLWERLWSDYLSSSFHLFIALAVLEKHRTVIIDHLKGFDEVLKYVNELSGTIDLPSTLARAEALFRRFQKTVEAIDKQNNFPSAPTVRQRQPAAEPVEATSGPSAGRRTSGARASGRESTSADISTAEAKKQIVSPELRSLLSREPPGGKKS